MKKKLITIAVAMALNTSAQALDTVIDPWNLAKNAEQITNQARQLQEMVQMVQTGLDLKKLAQFANEKLLVDLVELHKQAGTLGQLQDQITNILGAYSSAEGAIRSVVDIYKNGAIPGESFQDFFSRQSQVHDAVSQRANAAYEHVMSTQAGLQAQSDKLKQLHSQAQSAVGTDQLLQTANAQLNIIAQQQTQIISMQAERDAQAYEQRQMEIEEKKKQLELEANWERAMRASRATIRGSKK